MDLEGRGEKNTIPCDVMRARCVRSSWLMATISSASLDVYSLCFSPLEDTLNANSSKTFPADVRILILNQNKRHLGYSVTMCSVFRSRGKRIFAPSVMPEIPFRLTVCVYTLLLLRLHSIATKNVLLPTVVRDFDRFIYTTFPTNTYRN